MTEAGYEVIEAEGGAEAIETLEAREQPERLLAVICDLEMSGMDGVETIDLVRTGYPFLPVLVLTGKPDMTLAVSLIKKGIADYILKPFKPDTLKTAVDKAVTAFGCRAADQLLSAQL